MTRCRELGHVQQQRLGDGHILAELIDSLQILNRDVDFLEQRDNLLFWSSIITLYFFLRPPFAAGFRLDVDDEAEVRGGFLLTGSGLEGSGDDSSTTI